MGPRGPGVFLGEGGGAPPAAAFALGILWGAVPHGTGRANNPVAGPCQPRRRPALPEQMCQPEHPPRRQRQRQNEAQQPPHQKAEDKAPENTASEGHEKQQAQQQNAGHCWIGRGRLHQCHEPIPCLRCGDPSTPHNSRTALQNPSHLGLAGGGLKPSGMGGPGRRCRARAAANLRDSQSERAAGTSVRLGGHLRSPVRSGTARAGRNWRASGRKGFRDLAPPRPLRPCRWQAGPS